MTSNPDPGAKFKRAKLEEYSDEELLVFHAALFERQERLFRLFVQYDDERVAVERSFPASMEALGRIKVRIQAVQSLVGESQSNLAFIEVEQAYRSQVR